MFYFTKTTQRVPSRSQQWQKSMRCTSNCFPIHHIVQMWLSNSKKMLAGKRIAPNEEVIAEIEDYFEADISFYKKGIEKLEKRWISCISFDKDELCQNIVNLVLYLLSDVLLYIFSKFRTLVKFKFLSKKKYGVLENHKS